MRAVARWLHGGDGSLLGLAPLGAQVGDDGPAARLIAGRFVGAYRLGGRSGKNVAAAICEAASRSTMRYVPVKTVDQQSVLAMHRLRGGYKEERAACINRIRGLLYGHRRRRYSMNQRTLNKSDATPSLDSACAMLQNAKVAML